MRRLSTRPLFRPGFHRPDATELSAQRGPVITRVVLSVLALMVAGMLSVRVATGFSFSSSIAMNAESSGTVAELAESRPSVVRRQSIPVATVSPTDHARALNSTRNPARPTLLAGAPTRSTQVTSPSQASANVVSSTTSTATVTAVPVNPHPTRYPSHSPAEMQGMGVPSVSPAAPSLLWSPFVPPREFSGAVFAASLKADKERASGSHAPHLSGVYFIAADKIVSCSIPKVGSTAVFNFLQRISGNRDWANQNYRALSLARLSAPQARASGVFSSNAWLRVIVVRPPALRFASAFLDKCMNAENPDAAAVPKPTCPVQDARASLEARLDAVLTLLEQKAASRDLGSVDMHFRPLTYFCSLPQTLHAYTLVPLDLMAEGWHAALQVHSGVNKTRRAELATLADDTFRANYSGLASYQVLAAKHRTPSHELLAQWQAAALSGEPSAVASVMSRIVRLYASDYELLEGRLRGQQQVDAAMAAAIMGSSAGVPPMDWRAWLRPAAAGSPQPGKLPAKASRGQRSKPSVK
jgi:hypothetical protein